MDGWMEQTRTNIPIDQNNEKCNVIHILVNSKRIKIGEYEQTMKTRNTYFVMKNQKME